SIGGKEDLASLFEKPTETGDAVDARLRVRALVKAGPHRVTVAFIRNPQVAEPVRLQPFLRSSVDNFYWSGHPHLQSLTVAGPFGATGAGDTPSRGRIFVCRPSSKAEEERCAPEIISKLLVRAYRQPVADADLQRVMHFFESGRTDGGFE